MVAVWWFVRFPFAERGRAAVQPVLSCRRRVCAGCVLVEANPTASGTGSIHIITRTAHYGSRGFAVAGPTTWNSLPASLNDKQLSVTSFRRLLKTHLFRRARVGTPWARSWLFQVIAGEHKLLDLDLDLDYEENAYSHMYAIWTILCSHLANFNKA